MSEKPQTSNQTQVKPVVLSFSYRNTRMGGFDDIIIISFKSKKVIKSRLHTSRSGSHGERTYILFPGKYLMYSLTRSNLGNLYITVAIIRLHEDGTMEKLQEWSLYQGKELKILISELPKNIEEILMANKDQLPLFYYVLDQDQAE